MLSPPEGVCGDGVGAGVRGAHGVAHTPHDDLAHTHVARLHTGEGCRHQMGHRKRAS